MMYKVIENSEVKIITSENYNSMFNKETGEFVRFGKTVEDDPDYSPIGNEILDIEISTICNGINGKPCKACYKGLTGSGINMSFDTYKKVIDKMPKVMNQVALGVGDIGSNPDLYKIMEYTRSKGIIPNITVNGWDLTDCHAKNLVRLCGAVSVSRYEPKDVCYNAVKKLTDLGLKQCNIHMLVSVETLDACYELFDDYFKDDRLKNLNAIVLMQLKPKGIRNKLNILPYEDYKRLIKYAVDKNIPLGGDSCQAGAMHQVLKEIGKEDMAKMYIESCESLLFSYYINVDAVAYPCSFTEGNEGIIGINILECEDFIKDAWYHDFSRQWRDNLIKSKDCNDCRRCMAYSGVNIVNNG